MARDLAISLYLFAFKCVFALFNKLPLKDKTTFVISFSDNSKYIYEEMRKQNIQTEIVFLCKGQTIEKFKDFRGGKTIQFESLSLPDWIKSIYHLATSKYVLIDNYFGFLAAVTFKTGVDCIQLWHATGALKKFGLEDESIKHRSVRANQRFLQVYSRFDKVVAGSDVMADIFIRSFNLKEENILRTGIPRTDFFFNEEAKQTVLRTLFHFHPEWNGKKVILYAPTYRDHEFTNFSLRLDVEKMHRELGNDYIVLLRLHPAIRKAPDLAGLHAGFLYDCSGNEYEINELLLAADYLITDYSSIPFEYSLLRRPMIFFAYDLKEYKETRGLSEGFEDNLPGPIVKDTDAIIRLIKENCFDLDIIDHYAEQWNTYSKGHSSANLVSHMFIEKTSTAAAGNV